MRAGSNQFGDRVPRVGSGNQRFADEHRGGAGGGVLDEIQRPAHAGFGLPAPGKLVLMPTALDDTVVMSRTAIVTLSPGLTVVRRPLLSTSYIARNVAGVARSFGASGPWS